MTYITKEILERVKQGEAVEVKEHLTLRLSEGTKWKDHGELVLLTTIEDCRSSFTHAMAYGSVESVEKTLATATVTKGKPHYKLVGEPYSDGIHEELVIEVEYLDESRASECEHAHDHGKPRITNKISV